MDCFKASHTASIDEVIVQLKQVSSLLKQQINKYNGDITQSKAVLKHSIKNRDSKSNQLYYLKRVKLLESHMKSTTDRLLAIDKQVLTLESVKLSVKQFDAMQLTTKTLSHYMKQTDVDKIEDLQEKLSDYIADATEVSNIMNTSLDTDYDEEDLESELATLMEETERHVDVPLPLVPSNVLLDTDYDDTTVSSPLIQKTMVGSNVT